MSNNPEKPVIDVSKLDPDFKYEVAKEPGGEAIVRCYACGTCTASCPVRAINDKYNPRKIIHMVLLGMKKEVLTSEFVWLCSNCYACQERCPQDVQITDIMRALGNISVRNGNIQQVHQMQLKTIAECGRIYQIDDFDNKSRQKDNLPSLSTKSDDILKLLKSSRLGKYLESDK